MDQTGTSLFFAFVQFFQKCAFKTRKNAFLLEKTCESGGFLVSRLRQTSVEIWIMLVSGDKSQRIHPVNQPLMLWSRLMSSSLFTVSA